MNFWDSPIDASETAATSAAGHQRQQSLNEEVTEVMGQLNRFWGGFRKQSQDALLAARKDIGQYASQAQQYAAEAGKGIEREFTKLGVTQEEPSSSQRTLDETASDGQISTSASSSATLAAGPEPPTSPSASTNLFARLQSSLSPDIINTLQSHLPESIRHAPEHLDLAQLRSTLQQVRLQDATARGEELLKSAGDFLRDAVRVVPPSEASGSTRKGKAPMRDGAIGTRKDALLRALRTNAAILKVDPATEQASEASFKAWEEKHVASCEGGIMGEAWRDKIKAELEDAEHGLSATRKELVPSEMTEDTLWTRYFFRVYQIEQEEERRKALLAGPSQAEDDFSWEDEEEDSGSPTGTLRDHVMPPSDRKSVEVPKTVSLAPTPGTSSPSQSEGSYDIVSGHVSNASESATTPQPTTKTSTQKDDEGDGSEDSDWE